MANFLNEQSKFLKKPVRINLGAGHYPRNGFINIDAYRYSGIDLVADVRKLPFPTETVNEIYAGHLLEHIPTKECRGALLEWLRVLKPNGKITITVPDVQKISATLPFKEANDYILRTGNKYDVHRSVWTEQMLVDELAKTGYYKITRHNPANINYLISKIGWQSVVSAKKAPYELSIVIVNWNTASYLRQCLQSIHSGVHRVRAQTIVIDNASSDESVRMVRSQFPWVELIENSENKLFAAANNQGFHKAEGAFVLFLNPDTIVSSRALRILVRSMQQEVNIGAVTARFENPDGSLQFDFHRRLPTVKTIFYVFTTIGRLIDAARGFPRKNSYMMHDFNYSRDNYIEQAAGACVLVNRVALGNEDPFDERMPLFFNDVDLSKRILDNGYKIYYSSKARITHFGGRGLDQAPISYRLIETHRGLYAYFKKHFSFWKALIASGLFLHDLLIKQWYVSVRGLLRSRRLRTSKTFLYKMLVLPQNTTYRRTRSHIATTHDEPSKKMA